MKTLTLVLLGLLAMTSLALADSVTVTCQLPCTITVATPIPTGSPSPTPIPPTPTPTSTSTPNLPPSPTPTASPTPLPQTISMTFPTENSSVQLPFTIKDNASTAHCGGTAWYEVVYIDGQPAFNCNFGQCVVNNFPAGAHTIQTFAHTANSNTTPGVLCAQSQLLDPVFK